MDNSSKESLGSIPEIKVFVRGSNKSSAEKIEVDNFTTQSSTEKQPWQTLTNKDRFKPKSQARRFKNLTSSVTNLNSTCAQALAKTAVNSASQIYSSRLQSEVGTEYLEEIKQADSRNGDDEYLQPSLSQDSNGNVLKFSV